MAFDQAPIVVTLAIVPAVLAGGYNVRVQTLNFTFTPQNIDMDPIPGEGHAHLYLDGVKIARLYGEWYPPGRASPRTPKLLTVALYANDHSPFTVDGLPVSASLLLVDMMGGGALIVITDLHAVVGRIKALLDAEWLLVRHLLSTSRCAPAKKQQPRARATRLHHGAKAIILRVKRSKRDKFFVMLVFPADRRFNPRAVKDYFAARDIRFASEDEVAKLTGGVQPGGVPPFGNLFDLPVFCDAPTF